MKESTQLVSAGRYPERFEGMVNTPVFRGSTILASTMAEWQELRERQERDEKHAACYGRFGTPTHHAFQDAMASLEGGYRSCLYPSGLAAITSVLTALLSAGDHILLTDSAYSPTSQFLMGTLNRFGVEVTRYDPCCGDEIESLLQPNTRIVYVESPGSETLEIQDIPAIAKIAHAHGAKVVMDATWSTPLFFRAFEHGVDVSIQSATKYIVGHSDATLGVATCNEATWDQVRQTSQDLGQICSADDAYLAMRGLRTMGVRLKQHWESGLKVAQWLENRPEVDRVMHPALPSHPGHELWKRDFLGACGLFSIALHPVSDLALTAFIDQLQLFGLGLSWGGYESLALPFTPTQRTTRHWNVKGPGIRVHVGLEDPDDLIQDLEQGFAAMHAAEAGLQPTNAVA